ncbi:MAG TPA: PEP-CTERM sorting domain-containing protein [Desulfonatronum sp.]|nr:PEP-CTERM sorting domain-containing protein [Desulfonatronum sp.]
MNGDGVIDELDGVWAQQLSTAFFNTALGNNTADMKFRNIYESDGNHYWDDLSDPEKPILGAQMTDPLRAVNAVPEPGTVLLLGAGLLGLAAYGRKRYIKKN